MRPVTTKSSRTVRRTKYPVVLFTSSSLLRRPPQLCLHKGQTSSLKVHVPRKVEYDTEVSVRDTFGGSLETPITVGGGKAYSFNSEPLRFRERVPLSRFGLE